jgi:hypothetical protein
LNIFNILSVRAYPPTILTVAKTTAKSPIANTTGSVFGAMEPTTIIAPTRLMPEMALVADISGVCSKWGTLEISSTPRKVVNDKINNNSMIIESITATS